MDEKFNLVDKKFDLMDKRFDSLETLVKEGQSTLQDLMEVINNFATRVQGEFTEIHTDIANIKGQLATRVVTKDYLDEKLLDLKGELFSRTKKEDRQFTTLVNILTTKKILTKTEKRRIGELSPLGRV